MADTKVKWDEGTGHIADRKMYGFSSSYTCTDEEKQLVEVVAVSRCKDGQDVYVKTIFDFSSFEPNELLELAARPSIISARTSEFRSRTADEAIKALEGTTLDAKDYFKRERAGGVKDPEKAVRNNFDKLSKDQMAAMIAEMEAKMNSK
jgi:hypothetical protein